MAQPLGDPVRVAAARPRTLVDLAPERDPALAAFIAGEAMLDMTQYRFDGVFGPGSTKSRYGGGMAGMKRHLSAPGVCRMAMAGTAP
ncbi:hypothetical protein J2X65_004466 [Ancylobacter sp. 3268]|uniref:hypothetical protein n=1 Tax=Ancylobacter sp. 3268 TaxID=2817752 RepID=UPI0028661DD1|nr:hypothetical protein [Ancylobacter sp. 3268]MDR6955087.1 hypothetical protein [Ancylobacter sp. 3268]